MRALFFVYSLYLGACSFLCALATLRRGALLSFAAFAAVFFDQKIIFAFAVPFARSLRSLRSRFAAVPLPFWPFLAFMRTFCRSFHCKRLQRSFYAVFKRFLSVYLFRAYICTVCTVLAVYRALFMANLRFCGGGGWSTP